MLNTLSAESGDKPGRCYPGCQPIKAFFLLILAFIGMLGCKGQPKAAEAPEPKIEGEKVILTDDAPQKASLAVETAEPRKAPITHLTGRLMWNDDATVRIFTPVAGRVSEVVANSVRLFRAVRRWPGLIRPISVRLWQKHARRKAICVWLSAPWRAPRN